MSNNSHKPLPLNPWAVIFTVTAIGFTDASLPLGIPANLLFQAPQQAATRF
ncbi:hypothetical protein [Prochlorococcus sp. MIT 1342]|uniref:hypothetical protein n=1 Tax=Prochlorococcus sp. MIT 1342 TaxID=3082532 RepID=UPI0039B60E13